MEKNNKIFELHNYLNVNGFSKEVLNEITEKIQESNEIGFAGIQRKDLLKNFLSGFMFDKKENNQSYLYNVKYEENIKKIFEEITRKCRKYINKKINIFLFPTFDKFVIEKMNGVNGFSPWKNIIWIFINFKNNWEENLKETIVHELAHALSPFYKGGDLSIGYGIVLDGVAEHFKDFIVSKKKSSWTKVISKERAWEILEEIKIILEKKDFDDYNEIFYGTGKYPMWTGYTIGYYLIEKYFKKHSNFNWGKLLRKNPKEILSELLKRQKS
jgi:uncharacterized protein YjaZ